MSIPDMKSYQDHSRDYKQNGGSYSQQTIAETRCCRAEPIASYSPVRNGVLLLNGIPPGRRQSVQSSVFVECGEKTVKVSVMRDFLGRGQLIKSTDLSLGGCAFGRLPNSSDLFLVSELRGCGSRRTMSGDVLVYVFSLVHKPSVQPSSTIVRTTETRIGIECHYVRKHNVSSSTLRPTWISVTSTEPAEQPAFSLRLMTDDWSSERSSNVYFLGDLLHIEASVSLDSHLPLRLFLDSCVATLVPDKNTIPRYAFIESKGCLTDAKFLDSKSRFLPRAQGNQLRMLLEAFRFYLDSRTSFYITCYLKVKAMSESGKQNPCWAHSLCWIPPWNLKHRIEMAKTLTKMVHTPSL
ncbi:zona pellucida sperm-binding protein 3-like [Megalops cyprinoides]|uniref:zona pellucida sperm-binding protein 3-like n=1 Tax=Megalops cyprinoides TaxID=118141 RepID=UPI001863A733|nr:zona pellucida sperm-binding protein 3-like [Megalops cyprinoides]